MSRPDYAIVIPARDEADLLGEVLDSARAAFGDRAEYLVVDGGSRDATPAIARAHGARLLQAAGGRGAQLRAGAEAASAPVLLFLHADTCLPRDAAHRLDAALGDPRLAGGAFRLRFDTQRGPLPHALRLLAPLINLRSRLLRTATGDQAIFARAQALRRVGGVPPIPLFEDVRLYRALARAGRVCLLPTTVTTSPRLWLRHGPLRVVLLHLWLRVLYGFGVSPARLAQRYPTTTAS